MNKRNLLVIITGYIASLVFLFSAVTVYAQVGNGSQNGSSNTQNQGNNGSTTNTAPGTGSAASTTTLTTRFNPIWLIPLIGIPLLIAALASIGYRGDTRTEINNYAYRGTKGGQSEKKEEKQKERGTGDTDTTV